MGCYADFAGLYDMLTDDVEYEKRVDFIERVFCRYMDFEPKLIADLGCGTGTVCNMLADRGYDMIGIDVSDEMLSVAHDKSIGKNILYLLQDMSEFELYGTVDAFISMLDSVNYLVDDGRLERMFSLVYNYLNPGGIFVFDLNTPYKFKNILADNIFTYENDKVFYTWENNFDGKICEFYLNFFVSCSNDRYMRFTEQHFERCYDIDEVFETVNKSGLKVMDVFGDFLGSEYKNDDERVIFIVKKD